jgi:hypothetical protein
MAADPGEEGNGEDRRWASSGLAASLGKRRRGRGRRGVRGRERAVRRQGFSSPRPGGRRWRGSQRRIDGVGCARQQLLVQEEDDGRENGLGLFWASVGKEEKERWAGNGPKQGKLPFFSFKSLFYFLFFQNPLLFHKKGLQIQNYL